MEKGKQSNLKRAFPEDDDSNKPPPQKKVRFPKGKKVKFGDTVIDEEAEPIGPKNPKLAAKERVLRRNRVTPELLDEENSAISRAEFHDYQDNETFVDDDIKLEPFNLSKEREEGYFDADGNYVEYVKENEIKDAWLDSVEVQQQSSAQRPTAPRKQQEDDEAPDLNSEEIARIKRRIANVLEPGETVLKALKRLKGASNNRNVRMTPGTKQVFDQLTDDAVKLLNDGDLDVYNEKQENFQREADGYENLAQARGQILPIIEGVEQNEAQNGNDEFDMFAEDDAATTNPPSNSVDNHNVENDFTVEGGNSETDYIFDETSGYYYSSSSGYYYDPSSGLYCCASSGLWYSYNVASGAYEEVQQAAPAGN